MDNIRVGLLTKSASAYEYLRRLATEGLLRPDRRLTPTDLATELQVSVTPVRDALARLAAEGFISGRNGRGFFTKTYTVDEQRDLSQLLLSLSMTALVAAGERGQQVAKAPLDRLDAAVMADVPAAAAAARFVGAIDELISEFGAASGNAVLPVLLRNLLDRTHYVRLLDAREAVHRLAKASVMRKLVEAVATGNLAGAIGLLSDHAAQVAGRLDRLVAEANCAAATLKFP
jgi:GntR family transcriptional regulator, carbon starvation induced regulator